METTATKHTPGPWTVRPYLTPDCEDDPMGVYEIDNHADRLQEAYEQSDPEDWENQTELVHTENRANARLIAAAPEMLEALLAWHEYWDDRYNGEPLKDHEMAMLAAIRKAKGE